MRKRLRLIESSMSDFFFHRRKKNSSQFVEQQTNDRFVSDEFSSIYFQLKI